MNDVAFLFDVSPGPACTIPEDKKIFRVSAENSLPELHKIPAAWFPERGPVSEGPVEGPPLPVPHMYSA
jgi:hypothetical protein